MSVIVLHTADLLETREKTKIEDITVSDFKISSIMFDIADTVLFINDIGEIHILKNRLRIYVNGTQIVKNDTF